MLREGSLAEISDGKKYQYHDMVKADTMGCSGCTRCCEEMVDTIFLTPYDVHQLQLATGKTLQVLLEKEVELVMEQGAILPRFRRVERAGGKSGCGFLSEEGRCMVHANRPDICRLFPLGRLYENGDFSYILQTGQCDHAMVKTKVKSWLGIPNYEDFKKYVLVWHDLVRDLQQEVTQQTLQDVAASDLEYQRKRMMTFLQLFYLTPYADEFYADFAQRVSQWR